MRTTLETLRENVIIEARRYADSGNTTMFSYGLIQAINELDAHEAQAIDGSGALANRNSPETAHISAALASVAQGSVRQQIVALLAAVPEIASPGFTDEQLERRLSGRHQTVSSARNWLVKTGWVRDSGVRREGSSKRMAVVWELTPAAHRKIKEDAWTRIAV